MLGLFCKCCEVSNKEDFDLKQTEIKIEKMLSRGKRVNKTENNSKAHELNMLGNNNSKSKFKPVLISRPLTNLDNRIDEFSKNAKNKNTKDIKSSQKIDFEVDFSNTNKNYLDSLKGEMDDIQHFNNALMKYKSQKNNIERFERPKTHLEKHNVMKSIDYLYENENKFVQKFDFKKNDYDIYHDSHHENDNLMIDNLVNKVNINTNRKCSVQNKFLNLTSSKFNLNDKDTKVFQKPLDIDIQDKISRNNKLRKLSRKKLETNSSNSSDSSNSCKLNINDSLFRNNKCLINIENSFTDENENNKENNVKTDPKNIDIYFNVQRFHLLDSEINIRFSKRGLLIFLSEIILNSFKSDLLLDSNKLNMKILTVKLKNTKIIH